MIVVDTREHFIPQIQDLLVTKILGPEIPEFQFRCLPLADYLLENSGHSILIERKSISDFCGSYRTLKTRLAKMRKLDYDRIGLLLEGTYTIANSQIWLYDGNTLRKGMSYQTFSNFLTHQQELGVRLYYTLNLEETVWRLIHIHNYLPKLDAPTSTIKAGSASEWLSELPGIGPKTLLTMKEKYKTPLEAILDLPEKAKRMLESW